MKKIILPALALLLLGSACSKTDKGYQEYEPDFVFNRTGEVTLVAAIENASTKASLTGRGEARWAYGDKIAVVCTDGTLEELPLSGTGNTRKAIFKGTLPSGKTLGNWAIYPASAVSGFADGLLTFDLPTQVKASAAGECTLMVAPIGNSYEITFNQILCYALFDITNINPSTRRLDISSDRDLSGSFSVKLEDALQGVPSREGTASVSLTFADTPEKTLSLTLPMTVGEYGSLHVAAFDEKGKLLSETDVFASLSTFPRASLRAMAVPLPDSKKKEPKEGAALVADIYWALGNLEHCVGQTGEGFQTDWRLGPAQWYYSGCNLATAAMKAVTWKAENYDAYSLFNFGGLGMDSMDNVPEHTVMIPVGTVISGKMFLDRECTQPTNDFAAAKYGDIAFWASKGKYRLPTGEEFLALLANASRQFGYFKVSDNNLIRGILYFDPTGDEPVISDIEKELSAEEIAKGVFLPYAGRRYTAQPLTVNQLSNQGPYRSGEVITGSGAYDDTCYGGIFAQLSAAPRAYPYFNKDFGAIGGYSVRPVLVNQN